MSEYEFYYWFRRLKHGYICEDHIQSREQGSLVERYSKIIWFHQQKKIELLESKLDDVRKITSYYKLKQWLTENDKDEK